MRHSMESPGRVVGKCLVLAMLTIAAAACGRDVDAEIDQTFTATRKAEIRRAADSWKALATREVRIVETGDWLVVSANVPKGLGYAEGKRRLIRISPDTPDEQVYAVALHEFGHALGLRHTKGGVMDADVQSIEFTPEDLAECRRCGACPD